MRRSISLLCLLLALSILPTHHAVTDEYEDPPHVEGSVFNYVIAGNSFSNHRLSLGGGVFAITAEELAIAELIGTTSSIFSTTELMQFGQDGIASWEADVEEKTLTITMQHDVYWHDGTKLSLNDLVFAYEVLAHPDSWGRGLSSNAWQIVGLMDYHHEIADYIAGLQLSEDHKTLTIHFEEFDHSIIHFGIWTSPMPRHIFQDIDVFDMPDSDAVFNNPIGWGPFIFQEHNLIDDTVILSRNYDYVWGVPYIETMIIKIIHNDDLVPFMAETTDIDYLVLSGDLVDEFKGIDGFRYYPVAANVYQTISFRMGLFDLLGNRNVFDPNKPISNVNLRRALIMALDNEYIVSSLFNSSKPASGFLTEQHNAFVDPAIPFFAYDPENAKRILDEAGFDAIDEYGYRKNPDGSPLTLKMAVNNAPINELLSQLYIEAWAKIGVRAELWQGTLHEFTYLFDVLSNDMDNGEIDIYTIGWHFGRSPDPTNVWGHSNGNFSNYTSPELDLIFDRLNSASAWDTEYLLEVYSDLQWYFYENVIFFPSRWPVRYIMLSDRVSAWDTRPYAPPQEFGWHKVRLTS